MERKLSSAAQSAKSSALRRRSQCHLLHLHPRSHKNAAEKTPQRLRVPRRNSVAEERRQEGRLCDGLKVRSLHNFLASEAATTISSLASVMFQRSDPGRPRRLLEQREAHSHSSHASEGNNELQWSENEAESKSSV